MSTPGLCLIAAKAGSDPPARRAFKQQMRGYVNEHQQAGQEGAERFFMGTPTQEMLDMIAANAPEVARGQTVRLRDYPSAAQFG